MHTPGVCGAILAIGPPAGDASADSAARLGQWIDALNADTEMVLVAAAADDEALARAVWMRGAYLAPLRAEASVADALRALLQEMLNRGRDAALLTTLQSAPVSPETVRRMVAAYRAAGDEVWALLPEGFAFETAPGELRPGEIRQTQGCYPMLLGRRMIELFLRGQNWGSAEELIAAHREHVRALNSTELSPVSPVQNL